MSNNLFVNLGDQFDTHSGEMTGQVNGVGENVPPRRHYDIRAFHGDDITVPRTMRDFDYWNADSFNGTQIQVLDAPRIVSGRSVAARPIATINGIPLAELNEMEMADLDLDTVVAGNEGWTGTGVIVGKDATLKYANTIQVPLVGGVDKTVTSAFRDNILADFDTSGISLYTTGNEITDLVRSTGVSGDGRQNDSSYGIWGATTNLIANGGFETNSAGWAADVAEARSTAKAKFGSASLKSGTSGTSNDTIGMYDIYDNNTIPGGFVVGDILSYSIWVNPDVTVTLNLQVNQYDNGSTMTDFSEGPNTVCPAGVWTRLTHTRTVAPTVVRQQLYITSVGAQPVTDVYLDGAQIEKKPIPTPYVETNGATATRAASQVLAPSSVIDEPQSWFAMRLRPGWAANGDVGLHQLFAWATGGGANSIGCYYQPASDQFALERWTTTGGAANQWVASAVQTFAAYDEITVICAWEGGASPKLKISINGGAFVESSTLGFQVPTIANEFLEIGSFSGTLHVDGDILWFACGKGVLSNTNAADLHALGNSSPPMVSDARDLQLIWDAQTHHALTSYLDQHYIELALPDFPAQVDASHLDLENSWIDFTSSPSYVAGETDSFKFSDSLNPLTAGGDTYWKINRSQLANSTLSNITGIRFRLRSVNNMTFKAAAMRLIPDNYTWDSIDIDTKRGRLAKSFPRDGGTEVATGLALGTSGDSARYLYPSRPRNVKIVAKFNSGHIPASPNNNEFHLLGREDTTQNDRIAVLLKSNTTQTSIELRQTSGGVGTSFDTEVGAVLDEETDYFLILEMREEIASASLVKAHGAFFGATIMTTGPHDVSLLDRGYIGYRFWPYNYDFTIDYITVEDAEFARYESAPFTSFSPVKAVTLSTHEAQPLDIAQERYIPAGDAEVTTDPTFGTNAPSRKFVRSGLVWQGGYITDDFIYIGNSKNLRITGDIFPALATGQTSLRGEYRVVLLDKNDSVAYIGKIRNLLPSQWNQFDIHINADFAPGNYKVIIQQTGFYADTFWIDNLRLEHQQIAWEVSPDEGVTWYPVLFAKNKLHSAVNFIDNANSSIKVRAVALSEGAWVADYEVIPHYGYPGRMT